MNKVALVTGGSRGIGLGLCQSLVDAGCDLAFCGVREEEQVQDILTALRASGQDVLYAQADVAKTSDRVRLMDRIKAHFGRLHVLVNNAGVAPLQRMDLLDLTEDSYDRVMDINLKGSVFLAQSAAKWMIEQKQADPDFEACIININSVSATVASTHRSEYCISKAGMSMLTQLLAVRLGEEGIPVFELRPGLTVSDMTKVVKEKYDQKIEDGMLVQSRWGTPEDNGKIVVALVRGDFNYSTGQVFMVDGGLTLMRL